ncbi:hypothetical protein [Providencia huaxiensis]|uniref:hypothetical protein n=2 Tax=Morganellaceae TaxID=1903414 RepID=UPI0032DABABD
MQGENKIIVKFGIYEFQEGCAHLMEKVLCEKTQLEADKYNADLIPYKIIFYIRDHLFSKCTNENLIAIMLAAMQHAAPHKLFIFLLTLGPDDIDKIRNIAREMVNSRLSDNKKRMLVLRKKGFNQREIAEIISSLTGKKLSHQAVSKAILSVREEFLLYDIRD